MDFKCKECDKLAVYGNVLGLNLYCGDHKTDNHIITFQQNQFSDIPLYDTKKTGIRKIILKNICIFKECDKNPSYNFNDYRKILCTKHKLCGMLEQYTPKCITCIELKVLKPLIPSFGMPGEKRSYCTKHKTDEMINQRCVICIECKKENAYYNDEGLTAKYCKDCSKPGMISLNRIFCISCKEKSANFNYKGQPARYCKSCVLPDMENVTCKKCPTCQKLIGVYNYPGEKHGVYCNGCKLSNMIDVVSKLCLNEWCGTRASKSKYKGYCTRCFIYKFPDENISRFYQVKEKYVTDIIKKEFAELIDIKFNKSIEGGCSKRRPDVLMDLGSHIIIVEIDENQHRNYNITCDIARLNDIYTDLGDRPIVFIRFNPDQYYNESGQYMKSCFKKHGNLDIPIIDDKDIWDYRIKKLTDKIRYNIDNIPEEQIIEIYLFYSLSKY